MGGDKSSMSITTVPTRTSQTRGGTPTNKGSQATPGVVCQQGADWSRGTACYPQSFVRLVGHRDVALRASPSIVPKHNTPIRRPVPNDTPIG
jgi:hypothetical protein